MTGGGDLHQGARYPFSFAREHSSGFAPRVFFPSFTILQVAGCDSCESLFRAPKSYPGFSERQHSATAVVIRSGTHKVQCAPVLLFLMTQDQTALHITDVYFFDEFSKILGSDAGIRWLSYVHDGNRKARCSQMLPTCRSAVVECRMGSKVKELPRKSIQTLKTNNRVCCLPSESSQPVLDGWDIAPTEQAPPFASEIERSRSAPVFACPKSLLQKANSGNIGLLFTDAAHTVIGDLEFDTLFDFSIQNRAVFPG